MSTAVLNPRLADYLDPPQVLGLAEWSEQKRGAFLWSKQREIADSVTANRFTAVKSAHGTGKSWTAADVVAWWLDPEVHPIGSAFAITTAPTAPQVEAILWREINVAHQDAKLPGRITWGQIPMWKMGDQMVGYGRKPADYADANKAMQAFQGIHAEYVLVVLDEACGIPVWLWNAVDSIVTNDDARVLAIGNPDDPSSEFEKVCRPGSGYHVITVSAFDLPWSTGEEVPPKLHKVLTGQGWVEERRKKWGEGSPLWQSKVLGEFPDLSDDSLITPKMVRNAQEADLEHLVEDDDHGTLGGDVARLGVDRSCVYQSFGPYSRQVETLPKQNTMRTAGAFHKILSENGLASPMWIDISGLGAGVYDRLREQGLPVMPYDGGMAPNDPIRFKNRRAEDYWHLREVFETGQIDLDPLDDDLANELQSIKWFLDSRGRIVIESKDQMKKRGLPSPDRADALMMSRRRPMAVLEPEDGAGDTTDYTSDLLGRKF